MIIDATNSILGRLATVAAKKALLGEKVDIVNSEKAVVTGSRDVVLARFKQKKDMGATLKGPHYPKMPDRIVRRTIRGMLPFSRDRGQKAFKRIMCYIGVPEEFKTQKIEKIAEADVSDSNCIDYVSIEEISKILGAKL
jgi:large subunit ribosomal protein L13